MLSSKLQDLVGKTWMYKLENHKVLHWRADGNDILISTDKTLIKCKKEEAEEVIEELLPVEEVESKISPGTALMVTGGLIPEMKNLVTDNIKEIKSGNCDYKKIDAINKSVNNMLALMKLDIEAAKISGKGA